MSIRVACNFSDRQAIASWLRLSPFSLARSRRRRCSRGGTFLSVIFINGTISVLFWMSNGHDFFFFVGEVLVELGDVLIGEFLNLFFGVLHFVFGHAAILADFFQMFH